MTPFKDYPEPDPFEATPTTLRRLIISAACGFIVIALLAVLASLFFRVTAARAHEAPTGQNYSWACCASIHCKPVLDTEIEEGPDGYRIKATGEIVPYSDKRVHDSQDGGFHWCADPKGHDANRTICLYRAPRGS